MKKLSALLYWIASFAFMVGSAFDYPLVETLTKPLLMPLLALYFSLNADKSNRKLNMLMLGAAVFSWGGDVSLMEKESTPVLFLVGLVCFLIAHLCYIFAFKMHWPVSNGLVRRKPWLVVPFVLLWVGMVTLLWLGLDMVLKIAVPIYAAILIGMALSAMNRVAKPEGYWSVLLGALLFIVSDGTLAINAFYHPFAMASLIVMGTYIVSQWMIFRGVMSEE